MISASRGIAARVISTAGCISSGSVTALSWIVRIFRFFGINLSVAILILAELCSVYNCCCISLNLSTEGIFLSARILPCGKGKLLLCRDIEIILVRR